MVEMNAIWFLSEADARHRIDHDRKQPHAALGNLTPSGYAARLKPAWNGA
jgi:putative transposase